MTDVTIASAAMFEGEPLFQPPARHTLFGILSLCVTVAVGAGAVLADRALVQASPPPPGLAAAAPRPASPRWSVLYDASVAFGGGAPATLAASAPLARDLVTSVPAVVAAVTPTLPVAEADPAAPAEAASVVAATQPEPSLALPAIVAAADDVPLPVPRPSGLVGPSIVPAPTRPAPRAFRPSRVASIRPAAPADNRNFLQKFFGMPQQPATGPALAYATPEAGALGSPLSGDAPAPTAAGSGTAIYDIAAHTVYMPDGTRLEAHSGLGSLLDDPRSVHARNRGATPPHLYELSLREQLFHGVRALRLNPVGTGTVYGRDGLLAHTFMLGPNGDSNGCVSFRDYDAFLRAYQSGTVRRLSVVARS